MLTRGDQPPPAAQQQQQQQRPTEQDAGDLYQLVNMLQQSILTEQQRRHTKEDADEMERLKAQGAKGYVEASSLTKELFPGSFPVQDGVYPLLTETLQAEVFTKLLSLGSFDVTSEKVEDDKMMEFVIEEKAAPGNFTRTLYHSGAALDDHVAGNIKDEANKLFTVASQATASHRAKLSASNSNTNGSLPPPPPDALARFEAAVKMYTSAMASCQSNDTLAVLLNNRSTCFFNMGRVSASATDANASLMHKPKYWKALQRRGVCLKEMGSRRLAILAEMLNAAPTTTSSSSPSTTEEKLNADKSVFKQEALRMIEIGESDEAFALANADNSAADFGNNYVFDEVTSLLGTVSQNSIPPQPPLSQKSVHTDAAAENLLLQTVPSSLVLPLPNKKWCGTDASVDLTNINNVITVDRSDAKKGRAVHAKHQLLKGTTVLIETPYAVTPLNNNNCGYGVMTNRATGGNSQSGPNSNQINTGSSYCAMCMKRTDLLYPGPEYRTKALLPTLLPIQAIATALLEQHANSIVLDVNATLADQLLSVYTTVKALIKNVSLLHNGKKVDAATKKITTYVAVKIWEELADAEIPSLDISSLVAHGSIPAGIVGVKSRGLFCSGACATHSWETYGIYESRNPYFLVCPVDTLLATRVIATNKVANGQRGIALRSNENAPPLAIDEVADNRFGASHMDSLCAFTREAVPQLAEVGGKESVLAALACHFKVSVQVAGVASSAPFYEQLRKAHRQIVTNAFLLSCQDRVFMTNPSGPAGPSQQQHSLVTANVGKAMYSVASLFNHSCDPNCVVSFNGGPYEASGQLRIKLVRSVQEGEELTIQYGAVDKFRVHSTRGRIRALRAAHGFACACSSCYSEVDEPIKKEDEEYYHKASDYYQKGRRLTREGNFVDAINVLLQSYEIVMRYICPPPRAPQMMVPKTHDALAQAFLALSNGFATSPAGDKETPQAVSKRLREYHHNRAKAIEHLKAALALNLQLHKSITFNEPIPSIGITMGNNDTATTTSNSSSATALTTTTPPTTCYPAWLTTHHPTNTTKMMSAAFLTSEHLDIGTNVGIVEEYVRIAFLLAGEVESRVQTKHLSSATPETTSVTTNDDAVLATQRDEAILFAKKAIELLVLFYGCGSDADESSSLGAAEEGQQHSPAGGNSVTSLSSEVLRLEGVVEAMQHVM